jgi:hypothetical protein
VNLYGYVLNRPLRLRDPSGKIVPFIVGGIALTAIILTSPTTINAPGPGDPVYFPDNPIFVNAAGGAVCGALLSKFVSPFIARFWGGIGDDIIELGISQGPQIANKGYTLNPTKFDYFFGRVTTGNSHNILRSAQNLKDLTKMGITNESQLVSVFDEAFTDGVVLSIKSTQYGTTVVKSIKVGNNGSVDVGFFYAGGDMSAVPSISSIIPKTW